MAVVCRLLLGAACLSFVIGHCVGCVVKCFLSCVIDCCVMFVVSR